MFALRVFALRRCAAAAVLAMTVVASVAGCTGSENNPGQPVSAPTVTAPAASGNSGPSGSSVAVNVPVYYIGATKAGPRLYREYHALSAPSRAIDAQLKVALTEMLDGRTAYDKDYVSGWPASASVRSVTASNGVATVDLSGATVNGFDPPGNRAALQQLVWTATSYSGATGVKLLFDGKPLKTLWRAALPVAGVLHRAAAVDTLAPVWVIDPQANSVMRTTFQVNLAGIVFEGTVNVRIKNSSGAAIYQKTAQLTVGAPAQGTAALNVTLTPGTYTIEAYEVSQKDGSIVALDGHPFTVR